MFSTTSRFVANKGKSSTRLTHPTPDKVGSPTRPFPSTREVPRWWERWRGFRLNDKRHRSSDPWDLARVGHGFSSWVVPVAAILIFSVGPGLPRPSRKAWLSHRAFLCINRLLYLIHIPRTGRIRTRSIASLKGRDQISHPVHMNLNLIYATWKPGAPEYCD